MNSGISTLSYYSFFNLVLFFYEVIKYNLFFYVIVKLLDSCVFHPGDPFFHDAYKGWSCCKKKCTDFTEFLNIKVIYIWNSHNYFILSNFLKCSTVVFRAVQRVVITVQNQKNLRSMCQIKTPKMKSLSIMLQNQNRCQDHRLICHWHVWNQPFLLLSFNKYLLFPLAIQTGIQDQILLIYQLVQCVRTMDVNRSYWFIPILLKIFNNRI